MLEHAGLLAEWFGEKMGLLSFRKHATWYTKGFPGSAQWRQSLIQVQSIDDLATALDHLSPELEFPKD